MNIITDGLNRVSFWGDQSSEENDLSQATNFKKPTYDIS
jgi:hypothetical protein